MFSDEVSSTVSEALNRPAVWGMMDDLMFMFQKDTSEHEALWRSSQPPLWRFKAMLYDGSGKNIYICIKVLCNH